MHIALFGGAFDPPHLGHQQVVTAMLEGKIADEVWYVPVKNHPFDKQMTAAEHRVAMLELLQQPKTRIERYELEHPGISFTYDTLETLSAQQPRDTFSFIIGSDNVLNFHKWGQFEKLLEYCFYVYPRAGFSFEPLYKNMVPLREMPTVEVSSTQVRESVRAGEPIAGSVAPEVEEYIEEHQLYR